MSASADVSLSSAETAFLRRIARDCGGSITAVSDRDFVRAEALVSAGLVARDWRSGKLFHILPEGARHLEIVDGRRW